MSGSGSPELGVDAQGMRVALVAASWHEVVMDGLIAGAARACQSAGADASIIRVPGSFELPIVALECATSGQFDAVVALGVIIRGGTPHFDYVATGTTDGLMRVSLDAKIPVGFGLLTCDDEQQALDRAGLEGSHEDKGAEATWAALTTAVTLRALREG